MLRESQRILNCFLRCLGEIGRDQNFFQTEDLRNQFDGVRGLDTLSCGFHTFDLYPLYKNALRSFCGMVCIFCDGLRAAVSNPPLLALTNIRTFAGKSTLPEPWEVAAHVCYAFKPKSLNRLGANVGDGFFNRIRRENQI